MFLHVLRPGRAGAGAARRRRCSSRPYTNSWTISPRSSGAFAVLRINHFIDNRHVAPASGAYLPNREPATGRVYSELADGDARDVEAAVQAAARAFPTWSRTP